MLLYSVIVLALLVAVTTLVAAGAAVLVRAFAGGSGFALGAAVTAGAITFLVQGALLLPVFFTSLYASYRDIYYEE
jgi:hypothetical protein